MSIVSVIRAPAGLHRQTRAAVPRDLLFRVRRIGYIVLGLQFAGFLCWSTLLYRRFSLTPDFAQYHQAWYLIAHGNLDPRDTLGRFPFWQNHAEFMLWPLSLLYWVWPHSVDLLWLQDAGVAVAEVVAFTWMCEIARKRGGRSAAWLAGAGLVLLAINPWIWWGISFDYHFETIGIAFTALLAWDMANGRRRAWYWVLPLLACGDVTGTYLAGIGLGVLLAGQGMRRRGAALACVGLAAVLFITLIHGNRGSAHGLQAYAYLAVPGAKATGHVAMSKLILGIAIHPLRVLAVLWGKRVDLWANLAPSGLVGLGYLALLPLILVAAHGQQPVPRGPVRRAVVPEPAPLRVHAGGHGRCAHLADLRRRWVGLSVTVLVVAQAIGWAVVWGARTPAQWLHVPSGAAATLTRIEPLIPGSSEVIVSQGVVGRFADRTDVRILLGPGYQPVSRKDVWFIVLPTYGVETQSTGSAMATVAELAGPCTPGWSPTPTGSGCSTASAGRGDPGPGARAGADPRLDDPRGQRPRDARRRPPPLARDVHGPSRVRGVRPGLAGHAPAVPGHRAAVLHRAGQRRDLGRQRRPDARPADADRHGRDRADHAAGGRHRPLPLSRVHRLGAVPRRLHLAAPGPAPGAAGLVAGR